MTAIDDINLLDDQPLENEEGHTADHGYIHRGLKALKNKTDKLDKVPLSTYTSLVEPAIYPGVTITVTSDPPAGWSLDKFFDYPTKSNRMHIPGPPLVNDGGGMFYASWNGSDAGANSVSSEHAFHYQGNRLTGMFYTYGDMDFQFLIDGKLAKSSWSVMPSTPGIYFINLEFTDSTSLTKTREIRAFFGQIGFAQWIGPGNADMWPDRTRRYTFGIVAADSYYHGANGTSEGSISGGTLAHQLSIFTGGKTRTINAGAVGGTGYVNPATGTQVAVGPNGQTPYGSQNRRDKFATWKDQIDCAIIAGGANDANYPLNTVVTAAEQCWNNYAAMIPGKPLIVVGVESGVFTGDYAKLEALNNALKTAALANPNVTAFIDDRNPAMIWGTGFIDAKTGDGNADIMISNDHVHGTRFLNEYVTKQRIVRMGNIYVPAIGG